MTDTGCQQCGENTYSKKGASFCTSCPDGQISVAGSSSKTDCGYGRYCDDFIPIYIRNPKRNSTLLIRFRKYYKYIMSCIGGRGASLTSIIERSILSWMDNTFSRASVLLIILFNIYFSATYIDHYQNRVPPLALKVNRLNHDYQMQETHRVETESHLICLLNHTFKMLLKMLWIINLSCYHLQLGLLIFLRKWYESFS